MNKIAAPQPWQAIAQRFCSNGIIFDAERERNKLELERDSLKRLAKLTKKGELQNRIDRKNEEIDLLKVGLSGITGRYGFQTVHDFYKTVTFAFPFLKIFLDI